VWAWKFIKEFYTCLSHSQSLDDAVQAGREVLSQTSELSHSSRDFGAPVLWSRLPDGRLFSAQESPEQPSVVPPTRLGDDSTISSTQIDPRALEAYLYSLFQDASPVNLSGIQHGGGDETEAKLNLWEVYTALLTQRVEQEDRVLKARIDREQDEPRYESAVALLNK
jgi:hypothetical protein